MTEETYQRLLLQEKEFPKEVRFVKQLVSYGIRLKEIDVNNWKFSPKPRVYVIKTIKKLIGETEAGLEYSFMKCWKRFERFDRSAPARALKFYDSTKN